MIISCFGHYHYIIYLNTKISIENNTDNVFTNKVGKSMLLQLSYDWSLSILPTMSI